VEVAEQAAALNEDRQVALLIVSPGFLAAMRVPLLAGRDFRDQDDATAENVAIVNETMARRFWPGLEPLGRRFRMTAGIAATESFTVIGVAKAGKTSSLGEPPTPAVYLAYQQRPIASLFMNVVLRTQGRPERLAAVLRQEIHRLDPRVEPMSVQPMEESIQPAFAPVRMAAALLAILGPTALVLAALGLYGVMAYLVSQRVHELRLRMALGAQRRDVLRLVVAQGMKLVLVGALLGLAATRGVTPLLASFLYGVSPGDPLTFVAIFLLLAAVSLLACWLPARRGSQLDPAHALRAG
jgi:predicted permease